MLTDIVIEQRPGGDDEKVVHDVSSFHPIRGATGGGRERRETERQTGRQRSSVTLCQPFLCNLSCGERLGLISAKYYT